MAANLPPIERGLSERLELESPLPDLNCSLGGTCDTVNARMHRHERTIEQQRKS